jgi:nitrous oxidase accessory protein
MERRRYFNRNWYRFLFLAPFLIPSALADVSPLQLFVDLTPEGQVLKPIPGTYTGSLVIRRAIIFDGGGEVTLDGDSTGTVLTVLADGAIVRNLHIINSGVSHDQTSAGILVEANDVIVENNQLDNVLFGIHLKSTNNSTIRNNTIRSINAIHTLKGEGIRLWNSASNHIEDNHIIDARDVLFTNSPHNYFINNEITNCRIGMELIYSPACLIEGNLFQQNEQGLVGIYSDSLIIRDNRIQHQKDLWGSAIAVKGSSQILVQHNEILNCAVGITANAPIFPENIIIVEGNTFAYNDAAIYLYGDRGGHIIHDNIFKGNFQQVMVTRASAAVDNDWVGNYWDDYTGFDFDLDGIGDQPYLLYLYSERLWMDYDMARFFRGSPLLEMIDLVERIVSFSDPPLVLKDEKPQVGREVKPLISHGDK